MCVCVSVFVCMCVRLFNVAVEFGSGEKCGYCFFMKRTLGIFSRRLVRFVCIYRLWPHGNQKCSCGLGETSWSVFITRNDDKKKRGSRRRSEDGGFTFFNQQLPLNVSWVINTKTALTQTNPQPQHSALDYLFIVAGVRSLLLRRHNLVQLGRFEKGNTK